MIKPMTTPTSLRRGTRHHHERAVKSRSRYPSVQYGFVALQAAQDDLLCIAPSFAPEQPPQPAQRSDYEQPRRGHRAGRRDASLLYRAVVEVGSLNFGMKSAGEQEAILAGYAAFLNSLGYPVQLLTRILPLDVRPYLLSYQARLDVAADVNPNAAYRDLITDHLRYVRDIASQRALLERRFYLVLPAENTPDGLTQGRSAGDANGAASAEPSIPGASALFSGLRALLPGARRARRATDQQRTYALVRQRLALRADDVMRQLARFGVEGRRLSTVELLALYADCLAPAPGSSSASSSRILSGGERAPADLANRAFPSLAVHGVFKTPTPVAARASKHPEEPRADGVEWVDAEPGRPYADVIRIAHGSDALLDRLAPAAVEITRGALHVDNLWVCTLAVTGYPRSVFPGWLALLIDLDEPFELSLHIQPLSSRAMIRQLTSRMVALHSSRLLDQRHGRLPDPEREVAYGDMERLRDALQRGDERVFSLALYLLVRAPTRKALAECCARIQATLDHLQLQYRPATLEQDLGFTSCLPEAHDRLGRYRTFDTSGLATAFPFTASGLSMREGILYGVTPDTGSLVILQPFAAELENANQVVFAKSGAGKSYACKIQALRALLLGMRVCVVDPEDEYRRLAAAVDGQVIHLAPSSPQRINPFDLPQLAPVNASNESGASPSEHDATGGDALADKVQALHALLDLMLADRTPAGTVGLSQREKGLLDRCLYETYRRVGITSDGRTHDRPAPLLRDLYDTLRSNACGMDSFGLAERLERYAYGSLSSLFSAPTNVALDNPLVVFDVRDLDGELRPLGLLLIADYVWTRVRQAQQPHLLLIDEAWSLMQHNEGGRFLAGLARRARKHYLGLVTITQDVEDFLSSEWGRVVLSNSSIQLLMKQDSTTIDAVSDAFHLSTGERHYLLGCHKGEGLLFARGGHVQLRVEASSTEHALITTDPRELAQLAQAEANAETSAETDHRRQERAVAAQAAVHDEPAFVAGDDLDDERVARPRGNDEDAEVADGREEDDANDLTNGTVALGGPDDLPRLRVIARSGQAVSQAVSRMDALDGANHHRAHHQRDDEEEEGEGDDDAE